MALQSLRRLNTEVSENVEVFIAEGSAPSRQRNLAAFSATGEILYFLDDDSQISEVSLSLCRSVFQEKSVAVAGGPSLTPDSDSQLQKLFGLALQSIFGAGAMRYRYQSTGVLRSATERELILCNLAIRRSVFLEMSGFDERLYPNEENELLDRIIAAGYTALHIPDMTVTRSQRSTLRAFVRQIFGYGRGRSQQFLISGKSSMVSFVPLFFVIYVLSLSYLVSAHIFFVLPVVVYFLLNLACTIQILFLSRNTVAVWLFALFPLLHLANGCGLLYGLLGGVPHRRKDCSISTKCVKNFGRHSW